MKRKLEDLENISDEKDIEEGEVLPDDESIEEKIPRRTKKLEPKVMKIGKNSAPYVSSVLKTSFSKAKTHTTCEILVAKTC